MTRRRLEDSVRLGIERSLSEYSAEELAHRVNKELSDVPESITEEQAREAVELLSQNKDSFAAAFAEEADVMLSTPKMEQSSPSGRPVMTDGGLELDRDDIIVVGFAAMNGVSSSFVDGSIGQAFAGVAIMCLLLHFGSKAVDSRIDESQS